MQSRIQLIREANNLSIEEFASMFKVNREVIFAAENVSDSFDIYDFAPSLIDNISTRYQLPKKFILGYPYKVKKHPSLWHLDERQDYNRADSKMKAFLTAHFGYCDFTES